MMGIFYKKKSKKLPDYWLAYEDSFNKKMSKKIEEISFVVLDTETTGFSYADDRMLCIGALKLLNQNISIKESFEVYIEQQVYGKESAKIHGILRNEKIKKTSEIETLKLFLNYLGNSVIIAHHAIFDITMINTALLRHGLPNLKNKIIDTSTFYKKIVIKSNLLYKKDNYSLDELADKFNISKKDRHTALGDAYITAILFLKILVKMKNKNKISLSRLLE